MTQFSIKVNDIQVKQQLATLSTKSANLRPLFLDVGERFKILIDGYFLRQAGPDGARWQSNALSTTENYLRERGGYTTKGTLNAKGKKLIASKRVLQGITGELRRTIYHQAFTESLTIGSPKPYAALHNFGGPFKAWGSRNLVMPTRMFMPLDKAGNLTPDARKILLDRATVFFSQSA
jgi:phage gpG-like protein